MEVDHRKRARQTHMNQYIEELEEKLKEENSRGLSQKQYSKNIFLKIIQIALANDHDMILVISLS